MIPCLYEANETAFTTLGLGELPDALSCVVTSERNGMMSLEMEYPTNGLHYSDIAIGRIIRSAAWKRTQNLFVIESIEYSIEGVAKIYAPQYCCMRLSSAIRFTSLESYTWTKTETSTGDDFRDIMNALKSNIRPQLSILVDEDNNVISMGMTFHGDYDLPSGTTVDVDWGKENPTAYEVVQAVADALGGEIIWQGMIVYIFKEFGEDTGLEVRYRVNMTALDAETDGEPYATAVVPDGGTAADYVSADSPGIFPFYRLAVADLSETTAAAYLEESQTLRTSIKVQFDPYGVANLDTDSKWLQNLALCDSVIVVHPEIGLKQKAKIVKTVYNALTERYESMDIGEIMQDITDTIAALVRGK